MRTFLHSLGRRDASLLTLAFIDFLYAYSLPLYSNALFKRADPAAAAVAPLKWWAAFWAVTGVLLIIGVVSRRDYIGFGGAITIKVVWSALQFASWFGYSVHRAWLGGFIWLAFAIFVLITAGWPENHEQR